MLCSYINILNCCFDEYVTFIDSITMLAESAERAEGANLNTQKKLATTQEAWY